MTNPQLEIVFEKTVASMGAILHQLLQHVDPPVFVDDPVSPKFRFKQNTEIEAVLLKAVRIVSALHASITLLKEGCVQEIGVLFRTIDDFFQDVVFLLEGYRNHPRTPQKEEFLNDFYQEEFDNPESPFLSQQKRKTIPRKKIHAAVARATAKIVNPSDTQKMLRTVSQAHSGYVHGAYPHVMELYGGMPPRFHICGMKGTPRIQASEKYFKHYIYRGIQGLMLIAHAMGRKEELTLLTNLRSSFELDADYQTNIDGMAILIEPCINNGYIHHQGHDKSEA